jgi:hypothetical protein
MKLRRLFQPCILFILFFTPMGSTGYVHAHVGIDAEPSVTTTINPSSIHIGTTALVSVRLNNVPLEGYSGAEFTCTYSGNMLEAGNIVVSNLFGTNPITVINGPQGGKFILAIAGNQGNKATTNGPAFTFNVKGLQAGQVNINCTARVSNGDNFLLSLPSIGANLSILGTVPPGTATIPPTACDKAQFIADVTIPVGTLMFSGTTFRKTWRFTNIGSCDWSNYQIVFIGGEKMNAVSFATIPTTVLVGQTVDISLDMIAPLEPGRHYGYWMLRNNNGALFGIGPLGNQAFLVDINVSSATPTYTASPTKSPTPTFAPPTYSSTPSQTPSGPTATLPPGIFFDFVANACSAIWFSGAGQLPCPGTEGDIRGFMRKLDHPLLETGVADTHAGILTVPQNINNGYIQGIYPSVKVRSGDHFRATIGCEGGATNCYVVFRLDYALAGSNTVQTFWAFVEKNDANNYSADIDLSALAGQDIRFILTILSTGSPLDDRALWINPLIYRTQAEPTSIPSITATLGTQTRTPFPSVTPGGPIATRIPDTAFDFVANACSADWVTFASYLPLPCPGMENGTTGYILKLDHPILETGMADPRPGLLVAPSIRQNWVGEYIQGIYPPLTVQNGDRFRTTISCEGGAMDCDITFRLDYQVVSSSDTWFHTFWSFIERSDGESYSADVDLSPLVGQEVKFALTVLSNGSTITDDRALWIAPIIYRPGADFTPTPTVPYSTTTPTEDPSTITITGKVLASKPVTVDLYLLYNEDFSFTNTLTTAADGSFAFAATSRTYSIRAQADGALDARGDFVLNYREIRNMQTITLPAGDLDDNNVIDQFDALTIGMNYNASFPTVADLNNDGTINLLDLQLLAANYQKSGPIPWQ